MKLFGYELKRVVGNSAVINATVSKFDGSGSREVVYPKFNQRLGVEWFRSWVYIASMIVAQECARVPLRLYVRNRAGRTKNFATRAVPHRRKAYLSGAMRSRPSGHVCRKAAEFGDDYEEVSEPHPAVETLNRASDYANGFDLTVLRYVFLQLTGNAYLHPVFDRALGVPTEAWLLPSQWVEVQPDKQKLIGGYWYGSDPLNRKHFEPDEVIHFKLPNPDSVYYGRGKVEAAWSALELHRAKRETDLSNFQNRGRPDWLAILKNATQQEQIDRFSAEMERKVMGARKSGRFAAVGGDVDIKQLNFPPDDVGDPDRVLDEISGAFGVPRAMLTGAMNVSGGGTEQADRSFMRGTVAPLLCMDEQQLNAKWLPLFGVQQDAVLAYDNAVPEDDKFDLDRKERLVKVGVLTINEARAEEGMDASDDELAESSLFNGRPLGSQPASGFGGDGQQQGQQDTLKAVRQLRRDVKKSLVKIAKSVSPAHACSCGAKVKDFTAPPPEVTACANAAIPALIEAGMDTDTAVAAAHAACTTAPAAPPDTDVGRFMDAAFHEPETKNCGDGEGGFQEGNTCQGGGDGGGDTVSVKPTSQRAFTGEPVEVKEPLSKQEAGKVGENIVIAHLKSLGMKDARHMNLDRNNFPIDLIQDHEVIEVKTGQASNGPSAQQWRLTIGEPGKKEKAWLAKASDKQKAKWNERKADMIVERKAKAMADVQKQVGKKIKVSTVTVILNNDTKTADLYKFSGWHNRIGWNSAQAKAGYIGSVKYGSAR